MLSEEEFKNLAHLARLDPEDKSLAGLRDDFNKILNYVEKIKELNVESAGEYFTSVDLENVVRPDEAKSELTPADLNKMAPEWESGYFVVPRVIEEH